MRKQENWKKYSYLFNQHKKLTFECECGKKYVSFPGLYLHCQRKHDHKISTKFDPQTCKVIQNDEKIIYKYSLHMKRLEQSSQKYAQTFQNEKQSISTVLSKFAQNCCEDADVLQLFKQKGSSRSFIEKTLENFQNFILKVLSKGDEEHSSKQPFSKIAYLYNQFMEDLDAHPCSADYIHTCMILLKLNQWLIKEGHSKLIVELTQQQKKQQCN